MAKKNPLRSRGDRSDVIPMYLYCRKWIKVGYVSRNLGVGPKTLPLIANLKDHKGIQVRTIVAMRHLSDAVKHLESRVEWIRVNVIEPSRKGYGDNGYRRE